MLVVFHKKSPLLLRRSLRLNHDIPKDRSFRHNNILQLYYNMEKLSPKIICGGEIKNAFEESPNITFEEFIVAICRIVKTHGMKVIDEFINRFKKIAKGIPALNVEDPASLEKTLAALGL